MSEWSANWLLRYMFQCSEGVALYRRNVCRVDFWYNLVQYVQHHLGSSCILVLYATNDRLMLAKTSNASCDYILHLWYFENYIFPSNALIEQQSFQFMLCQLAAAYIWNHYRYNFSKWRERDSGADILMWSRENLGLVSFMTTNKPIAKQRHKTMEKQGTSWGFLFQKH